MGDFHILVVEDEAISAFALEDLLTSHGYRVTVALNGLAGLEAMERDPADAILTDLRMPKLDGKEMIRRLRARGIDVPVIVMTGYMGFGSGRENLADKGTEPVLVLQKPIDFSEVLSSLRKVVGHPAT
jgi:CheY-like chemotaxis protein